MHFSSCKRARIRETMDQAADNSALSGLLFTITNSEVLLVGEIRVEILVKRDRKGHRYRSRHGLVRNIWFMDRI